MGKIISTHKESREVKLSSILQSVFSRPMQTYELMLPVYTRKVRKLRVSVEKILWQLEVAYC